MPVPIIREGLRLSDVADADAVISMLQSRRWPTVDLVRIAHAVAQLGKNTTSIPGQDGKELIA